MSVVVIVALSVLLVALLLALRSKNNKLVDAMDARDRFRSRAEQAESMIAKSDFNHAPVADDFTDQFNGIVRALIAERMYHARRWGVRSIVEGQSVFTETNRTVAEFLLYMDDYLREAKTACSREASEKPALEVLRKVVTLGLACFEQNGCPLRDLSLPIVNAIDGKDASFTG